MTSLALPWHQEILTPFRQSKKSKRDSSIDRTFCKVSTGAAVGFPRIRESEFVVKTKIYKYRKG